MNRMAVAKELMAVAKLLAYDDGKLSAAKAVLDAIGKISGASLESYKNGRENGFALSKGGNKVAFSENRNSDDIVVYTGTTTDFEMGGNIPSEESYRNKKYFGPDDAKKAAQFIKHFLV